MVGKLEIPRHFLNGVSFSMYTSAEIKKLSVKEITNPQSFDAIGQPTIGGLYDPALGPSDPDDNCKTCGLVYKMCPGHMGHIRLPLDVYNPVLFQTLFKVRFDRFLIFDL